MTRHRSSRLPSRPLACASGGRSSAYPGGMEGMYGFAADLPIDVEAIRARFHRMTDDELLRYGRACRYMCSPWANFGKPPRETAVVQLTRSTRRMEAETAAQDNPITMVGGWGSQGCPWHDCPTGCRRPSQSLALSLVTLCASF